MKCPLPELSEVLETSSRCFSQLYRCERQYSGVYCEVLDLEEKEDDKRIIIIIIALAAIVIITLFIVVLVKIRRKFPSVRQRTISDRTDGVDLNIYDPNPG